MNPIQLVKDSIPGLSSALTVAQAILEVIDRASWNTVLLKDMCQKIVAITNAFHSQYNQLQKAQNHIDEFKQLLDDIFLWITKQEDKHYLKQLVQSQKISMKIQVYDNRLTFYLNVLSSHQVIAAQSSNHLAGCPCKRYQAHGRESSNDLDAQWKNIG